MTFFFMITRWPGRQVGKQDPPVHEKETETIKVSLEVEPFESLEEELSARLNPLLSFYDNALF